MAFPTLALSTLSTASTAGRWSCSTSTPAHASCPSCSTVSDKRLPNRLTLLSTPSPGSTIMGPIWTSSCGGHTCVTEPPYVLVMSRSFMGLLLCSFRKGAGQPRPQWTTAQDDPQRDATRSHAAMRGHCTIEDEPGTASYYMVVQPEDSLVLFVLFSERVWVHVYGR